MGRVGQPDQNRFGRHGCSPTFAASGSAMPSRHRRRRDRLSWRDDEDSSSGKLVNFKRGITTYPIPGSKAYPVAGHDLKQMFAADERAHIEIGNVYPTKDVRAALYVDALLGKHFALLGSTGTGKSTSAALIMHRICDMSPEGHIVMIDPHGEYSAAFKGYGELFNVDNLAMPYWLMNFEEHCEVC
jgi:hypothetical protein